jgi:hypothetical protein
VLIFSSDISGSSLPEQQVAVLSYSNFYFLVTETGGEGRLLSSVSMEECHGHCHSFNYAHNYAHSRRTTQLLT